MDLFVRISALVLSATAVAIAVWGDWLKDNFGWRGKAKLTVDVDPKTASAHYHHGWIEDAVTISDPNLWAQPPLDEHAGRLMLHFFRAKITNVGRIAAKSVTVWIRSFECCDSQSRMKPLENVMPLRWSDFWRLTTDCGKRKVSGSQTDISFALLPADSSKYCDICFYYDLTGPPHIGGLKRNWVYFSVLNIPSSSYAIKGNGAYAVHLHIAAENARPLQATLDLVVDWNDKKNPVKMHLRAKH